MEYVKFSLYECVFIFYINIKHAFQMCLLEMNLFSRSLVFCKLSHPSHTYKYNEAKQKKEKKYVCVQNLIILFLLLKLIANSGSLSH